MLSSKHLVLRSRIHFDYRWLKVLSEHPQRLLRHFEPSPAYRPSFSKQNLRVTLGRLQERLTSSHFPYRTDPLIRHLSRITAHLS